MSVDAAAADRLPWLSDEPRPSVRRGGLSPAAAAAVLVTATGGLWIAARAIEQRETAASVGGSTTVRLPAPAPAKRPELRIASEPDVRATTIVDMHPATTRTRILHSPAERHRARDVKKSQLILQKKSRARQTHLVAGAAGRVVEIGAFGSIEQAKRGWSATVRANPALARLPAKVAETRNSRGRTFYRMRLGTTSHAQSEVLCQRMRAIGLSCQVSKG